MNNEDLQPLSVGQILDLAVRITRTRYLTLMKTVAVVVVPVQLFIAIIEISTTDGDKVSHSTSFFVSIVTSILGALAGQLASAACLRSVAAALLGEHAGWQASLEFAWSRFSSIIWVAALTYVLASLGLILLVVPGVYLWISWLVGMPVLLLEGRRGTDALRRSRELVAGRWWPTFGTYLVAMILAGIISAVLSAVLLAVTGESHAQLVAKVLLSALVGSVTGIITTPFIASVIAIIYFDLRVRKEDFGLGHLATGLGG